MNLGCLAQCHFSLDTKPVAWLKAGRVTGGESPTWTPKSMPSPCCCASLVREADLGEVGQRPERLPVLALAVHFTGVRGGLGLMPTCVRLAGWDLLCRDLHVQPPRGIS